MTRENKFGMLANLILVMLMSASISQTLYTSLFMTSTLSLMIFIAVIPITLLFFVMFRTKLSSLVSCILIAVILTAGSAVIIFKTGIESALIWLNRYSIWFVDITNGYKDISVPVFTTITILSTAFIITLFVFIFTIKFYNFYVTTIMFFSIFFVQLQLNISGSDLSFVLFIFSFLLYYFFYILQKRNGEKTYDAGNRIKYLIYILPVCIIVIAITFMFPLNQGRFSIPWLDTRIDKTIDRVINKFSGVDVSSFDYFSFGISGFGKTDKLGGNLKLNNTHVMNVKTDHSNLYLRAASKVNYDGHRWYTDEGNFNSLGLGLVYDRQFNSDTSLMFMGLLSALKGRTFSLDMNQNDYFESSAAEVEFVNMKTKSIFMPVKAYNLKFRSPQEVLLDNEQMLSTKDIKGKGFSYNLRYFNLNLKSEKLIDLLRKSSKSDVRTSIRNQYNVRILNSDSATPAGSTDINDSNAAPASNINDTADSIYTNYTRLPDTVTPRVRELAQEITKDKSNNYDRAKAIETYLSKNYPYTLAPGTPPRSRDFVDYFLFDGKKGYCTYYASAMTVLLRCLDIPARYVEGYILPPEKKDGVYKVTNQQAHAWVEVYFDGFGWIPFEPTSPFVANLYNDRTISATISSDMLDTGYNDYMEMMDRYRNQGAAVTYDFDTETETDSGMKKPVLTLIIISAAIGLIVLVMGTIASINYFKFYNLQRKIKKGDPNSSMLIAYGYILKALKFQGVTLHPGETPTQFSERVEKIFDIKSFSFNKTSFTKISGYYVKARYSRDPLTHKEIEQTLEFINVLLELIFEKSGRFKFGFSRYLLGRF